MKTTLEKVLESRPWKDTGLTVKGWPILQDEGTKRLYVGELLRPLNPSGAGGRVWSAMDAERLKYNVHFTKGKDADDPDMDS